MFKLCCLRSSLDKWMAYNVAKEAMQIKDQEFQNQKPARLGITQTNLRQDLSEFRIFCLLKPLKEQNRS